MRRLPAIPLALVLLAAGAVHTPAQAAADCAGVSATQVVTPGNTAPTLANDSSIALAGGIRAINVLGNDSDAEGNPLYVVNVSQPGRGESCVNGDGTVEYFGVSSEGGYTTSFRYGVTDGDHYRTATVTVRVQGIKAMRARLMKRLKKRQKAKVWFTNPNNRTMVLLAGVPKKERPLLTRSLAPGATAKLKTKSKRVVWYALVRDLNGEQIFVNLGTLNTRNARQSIFTPESLAFRSQSRLQAQKREWMRSLG